jgi:hypothetical protein
MLWPLWQVSAHDLQIPGIKVKKMKRGEKKWGRSTVEFAVLAVEVIDHLILVFLVRLAEALLGHITILFQWKKGKSG